MRSGKGLCRGRKDFYPTSRSSCRFRSLPGWLGFLLPQHLLAYPTFLSNASACTTDLDIWTDAGTQGRHRSQH